MSMTLNLEAAEGVALDEVAMALALVPGCEIARGGSSLEAYFRHSNVFVNVKADLECRDVLTEGLDDVSWKVGLRIYFDIDPSLSNALDDIREFVHALAKITSAPFILSFEYGTLYCRRDEESLTLSGEFAGS